MAAQSKTLHKPESCIYFRLTGVAIFAVKIFKSPLWLIMSFTPTGSHGEMMERKMMKT